MTTCSKYDILAAVNESTSPTLTAERRDAIADLVAQQGAARVAALAERFDVSTATIRRDLETLEEEKALQRVHGGAVAREEDAESTSKTAERSRIGQTVVEMIEDGETIFLGPGQLPLEVAQCLQDSSRITVVTNGLDVAHWVAANTSHTLIVTGGQVEGRDLGLTGQLTRTGLANLRADRVILELGGVSAVEGLTHDNLPQAEIARELLETGSEIIALVPAERIGRVAAVQVAPVTEADIIVTARDAPDPYLWDLSETGVRIILA